MDEGDIAFSSTHSLRGMMGGGVQWKTGAARGNPGRNHFRFAKMPVYSPVAVSVRHFAGQTCHYSSFSAKDRAKPVEDRSEVKFAYR